MKKILKKEKAHLKNFELTDMLNSRQSWLGLIFQNAPLKI